MKPNVKTDKRQAAFFNSILVEEMAESKRMRSMVLIALLGFQGVFLFRNTAIFCGSAMVYKY